MINYERCLSLPLFFVISMVFIPCVPGENSNQIFSMDGANWAGDACTAGGIDIGLIGDGSCIVVSGNNDMNYPAAIDYHFTIDDRFSQAKQIEFQIGYRANAMQSHSGQVFLNGTLLAAIDAYGDHEELKLCRVIVDAASVNLSSGTHTFRFSAGKTDNQWNYFQVDAVRIAVQNSSSLTGGISIPYELFPLSDGNWIGDGGTWGGLDRGADMDSDRAAIVVQQSGRTYPSSYEIDLFLKSDYSRFNVQFSVAFRRNQRMASRGLIFWDGKPILSCSPHIDSSSINYVDSILDFESILLQESEHDFSSGRHRLSVKVEPSAHSDGMFQVDSILIEGIPRKEPGLRLYLDESSFEVDGVVDGIHQQALNHFIQAVRGLGLSTFNVLNTHVPGSARIIIACGEQAYSLLPSHHGDQMQAGLLKKTDSLQRQSYCLSFAASGNETELIAASSAPLGCVYSISDLQLRLKKDGERVYLDFPEWRSESSSKFIQEIPSVEDRGEYLNIGYNFKDITPHEWNTERWHQYIDMLVLARLNRLYFYIWNDIYTMYPGSEFSRNSLNLQIHENIREAIDYAHSLGLDVTYMICPTYFPADIWQKHPEMHAEIEYVAHGFPAVCPNAPGAWEMMKDIYRSEMQWFSKSDALQIWFYDPGGCWCEKNGCRHNQAAILARQFNEFSQMFKELNPAARFEFNIWPIWLWEHNMKIDYRKDLSLNIKRYFSDQYNSISAVGAPDNDTTLPLLEKELGYRTSAFIFGTNPENGYIFLMPNLSLISEVSHRAVEKGIDSAFGHRLEAWTRYPSTFFMGQLLWNPDATHEHVVNRFASWVTADPESAIKLSEAILLLDKFTYEGADQQIGLRMSDLAFEAFDRLDTPQAQLFEYIPSMLKALSVIGSSVGVDDNSCLTAAVEMFRDALRSSATLSPFEANSKYLFEKYRGFLIKGSRKSPF